MSEKITESQAQKEISKFFGPDTIFFDGDVTSIGHYDYISTGSPSLDEAIGIGGIPRGRIVQLAGKESSGKTMLALSCIKSYLDLDPENTALFVDAEYTYDPEWAASQGVDVSRVMVIKTNDAKAIFEGLLGTMKINSSTKKVSKNMKGILDYVIEGTEPKFKNLGLVVLDSIAVLNTPMEVAASIGKANMAPIPRFLSTELKKLTPVLAKANVAFIGINQVRVNLGQMFGDPTSSPGGKALKHACSLMINMAPILSADSRILDESGTRIGHKVRAKIGKNKVATPFKTTEYSIEYLRGITSREQEIFDLGVKYGFIERPSAQFYVINGEKIRGRDAAISLFIDNKELVDDTLAKVEEAYTGGLRPNDVISNVSDEEVENPLLNLIE